MANVQANEAEKRRFRCCFTGHRPQKLTRPVDDIKIDLENEIIASVNVNENLSQVLTNI